MGAFLWGFRPCLENLRAFADGSGTISSSPVAMQIVVLQILQNHFEHVNSHVVILVLLRVISMK